MGFSITITADTAAQARHKIRQLAALLEADVVPEPQAAAVPEPQAAAVPEPQAAAVPEPQAEEQPPWADAPTVSLEEVRAKLSELMRAGKRDEVRGLFGTVHSGATKLSEVPETKFGQLLQAAEALS